MGKKKTLHIKIITKVQLHTSFDVEFLVKLCLLHLWTTIVYVRDLSQY